MSWLRLMPLAEVARDRGVRVVTGSHRIALFRVGDDVFAIGDVCSHAEASLAEGEVFDYVVECPRHGSEFDLRTGEPSSLPATRPVPVYETRASNGDLYVYLEEDEE